MKGVREENDNENKLIILCVNDKHTTIRTMFVGAAVSHFGTTGGSFWEQNNRQIKDTEEKAGGGTDGEICRA